MEANEKDIAKKESNERIEKILEFYSYEKDGIKMINKKLLKQDLKKIIVAF